MHLQSLRLYVYCVFASSFAPLRELLRRARRVSRKGAKEIAKTPLQGLLKPFRASGNTRYYSDFALQRLEMILAQTVLCFDERR